MAAEDWIDDYWGEEQWEENPEVLSNIKVLHETDKARLIVLKYSCAWFPKSISFIEDDNTLIYDSWFEPEWKDFSKKKMSPIEGDFI